MPRQPLPLLPDERTTALDGFIAILKRDPWLKAARVTWLDWSDSTLDYTPEAEASLPLVILTAEPEASFWQPSQGLKTDMLVHFDIALDGTDQREGMRFWRAIERAISPSRTVVYDAMIAAGISGLDILKPGYGIKPTDPEDGTQSSRGTVRLELWVTMTGDA
jgi:hypothetical protein